MDGLGGFRVVSLDRRGHGESARPFDAAAHTVDEHVADLIALADLLELERFAFWGYSDGARIGYALAAAHPRRVVGLVASGTVDPRGGMPDDELHEAAREVREHGVGAILGDEPAPACLLRQLIEETDPEIVARELESFAGWSPWPLFPRIEAPTLIVAGELEDAGCAEAAARIPDGRALILPELGHLGAFVNSELVLPPVRSFVEEVLELRR